MFKFAAVPVMLVPTRVVGVPRFGDISVGLLANTAAPVPVSSDNAPLRPAELVSRSCLAALTAWLLASIFWMASMILSASETVPVAAV